jgi:predicted RNA-binding protein (virulence factor B family)
MKMAEIGKMNLLKAVRKVDFGFYLDGGDLGEILLPMRYAPEKLRIGSEVSVFVYTDSEDRIIATTEQPYAMVGEFACLEVAAVNDTGAFLDWGLPKDLLVPFREQKQIMEEGKSYVVYIYLDAKTNRIAASAKISHFLGLEPAEYVPGDEVDLLITGETDLGYKAIINMRHEGILYRNEVFIRLRRGDRLPGYIQKIRNDGKIDLRLSRDGYAKVDDMARHILYKLDKEGGFLPLSDKSPAEDIYAIFGISKKTFKMAIGALYKERLIDITNSGIRRVNESV